MLVRCKHADVCCHDCDHKEPHEPRLVNPRDPAGRYCDMGWHCRPGWEVVWCEEVDDDADNGHDAHSGG